MRIVVRRTEVYEPWLTVIVFGNTYYLDTLLGDDTNPGTSQQQPWKTLLKADPLVPSPGDSILFKKYQQNIKQ